MGGIEVRPVPLLGPSVVVNFGILGGGLELMKLAVPALPHVWTMSYLPTEAGVFHRLLSQKPVDLVFVEMGHCSRVDFTEPPIWVQDILRTPSTCCPRVVMESWPVSASLWKQGPTSKLACTRWQEHEFVSRCQALSALVLGGSIDQHKLLVVRIHHTMASLWNWAQTEPAGTRRPMSNLLDPPGLVPRRVYLDQHYSCAPDAQTSPMPPGVGRLISTTHGIRRLFRHEVIKGLGGDPETVSQSLPDQLINSSTSLFHWNYLMEGFWPVESAKGLGCHTLDEKEPPASSVTGTPSHPVFSWRPPFLGPGGTWYNARLLSLRRACDTFPDSETRYLDGLRCLHIMIQNYDSEGPNPQCLQLLWWEFPSDHWQILQEGCSMNFLRPPPAVIHPNSDMDADQLRVAGEFVDELLALSILIPPPPGVSVLATTPLFCVPKEGQPDQWRVIADMLRGGQNTVVGADPVFLPKISHILDSLYTGGYSAVVDASKFYHQFPTRAEDQPYLGVVHPVSQQQYVWAGLPMGAGNSPAMGNRFGVAFLRKLLSNSAIFQGDPQDNCYWTHFSGRRPYDPTLGYGLICPGAAYVWAYVDDFLIHGPTHESCATALQHFLDAALECGMLCHPKKLIPPSQVVKYCGFLVDTTGIPTLRIPDYKKERTLAMLHYVSSRPSKPWSRLALAVLAGTLESLVECTPRRLGHTHLRDLHALIHPPDSGTGLEPYLSCTKIPPSVLEGLSWWQTYLQSAGGRMVRPPRASVLVPTFGDGSGTGTGGTFQLPFQQLHMWKAAWQPTVYKFSSNHKELATLRLTLETILTTSPESVRDTTLFYFTDNSCTYWVCNNGSSRIPSLHSELVYIRDLEVQLGCHVSVVHVPGKVMIQEGTDGLSRGVWMSPLHSHLPREQVLSALFAPLTPDSALVHHYVTTHVPHYHQDTDTEVPLSLHSWSLFDWTLPWYTLPILHQFSVWFPPPELARTVISTVLSCFVESPLDTAALFFVPRVVPSFWHNLSRYLVELPTVFPHLSDLLVPPLLPIPIVVLYLPCHTRRLSQNNRLDKPPAPYRARWHRQQAEDLRRVSFGHQ